MNSFFSSLVDGRLPPWLLAHLSAILTRMTTYGVCLWATVSCTSKSMLSANLSCIWNTRCMLSGPNIGLKSVPDQTLTYIRQHAIAKQRETKYVPPELGPWIIQPEIIQKMVRLWLNNCMFLPPKEKIGYSAVFIQLNFYMWYYFGISLPINFD